MFALRLRVLMLCCSASLAAQDLEPFELTPQWLEKIEALAPEPTEAGASGQRILIFSLATGYQHWAIPHTEAVVRILVQRSGVATCTTTRDIGYFEADQLAGFDAVVLNNTCPERDERDIFYDIFRKDSTLSEPERRTRAAVLEANLIAFVRQGGGLVLLHGGTTMQLNSMPFSEMTGGSFDFHPPQQPITLKVVDPKHKITAPFRNGSFSLTDEPYFFKNAYAQKAFKPLLAMDAGALTGVEQPVTDPVRYVSWIKRFGKGRVFVSAPSHNAQAFENPEFLAFLLQGMRYTLGQISANDEPLRD